jgi:hypothetical protein
MDAVTPSAELDEDWCSIAEAARRLGVTPAAIHNRIRRGTLPTRPNGNHGKLVKMPLATCDSPVTVTDDSRVTITVMVAHIETLKEALIKAEATAAAATAKAEAAGTKAEAAGERACAAEVEAAAARAEAATVPALRDTVAALKAALDAEQARNRELRRERDAGGPLYRAWRWMRKAG